MAVVVLNYECMLTLVVKAMTLRARECILDFIRMHQNAWLGANSLLELSLK